jgi:hypothetical protein
LELFFDKGEFKKKKMIFISLAAFLLNLVITFLFPGKFFIYIFYFTIFHNLRQGLGLFLIYFIGEARDRNLQKRLFYCCTIIPVLLFHFKGQYLGSDATYSIRPMDLAPYISQSNLDIIFNLGAKLYLVFYFVTLGYLLFKRQEAFFIYLFFTGIYSLAFLLFKNIIWGMLLLVFSHGIPYFFLFNKRINLTHSSKNVRKYSPFFILLFFSIGALFELTQEDFSGVFAFPIRNFVFAIIFYPMTVHYIFDSFIWKSGNTKYDIFKKSIKTLPS